VLILRYRYGLSCAEIGEVLGIATTTVYDRLAEARRRLRQKMERDADDADNADFYSYQRHLR
jgi:DNA-directed RNA polymerase specialized sigma24 family protein